MGVHCRRVSASAAAAAALIVFCFAPALGNVAVGVVHVDLEETNQRQQQCRHNHNCRHLGSVEKAMLAVRRPSGPGSSPPTCRSKCGRCHPCVAVHVSIRPGVSRPLDYYPEAWRCRCGSKYFMP